MLSLSLTLDKPDYAMTDAITAKVILLNKGSETLKVNRRLLLNYLGAPKVFCEVSFIITNSANSKVPFAARVNASEPEDADFTELGPQQSIEESYLLRQFFRLDEPGRYTLQAIYQNSSDPSTGPAWKGKVESDQIVVDVKG
jgi:hypothetical protein